MTSKTATRLKKMEWLLEDLLRAKGDKGLLQGQLTHALACRHCTSNICLQSPGNLVILFLFMVWQIRRWWQLRRWQQLQPRCSGDIMMEGKGLQLLYHLAFLDCLWKQNSEEEKEDAEEKEESFSLDAQKPYSHSKDTPIGDHCTAVPPQPSCSSESLPKATETRAQVLTQPSSPSRSFPTFQILTNLSVRNKTASGSSLQQRKSQLFWGLPSLHSESLETILLSSDGASPLKLSTCPPVFNKVAFLPEYNLLLPYYHPSAYCPTPEAHTMEDLLGMTPGSQLVQFPPSPIPPVSYNLKPLPMSCKRIISDSEAHTQWFTQNKEVPSVSENQAQYPQPELQKIRPSTFLYTSESWRGMPEGPSLHQHNPESPFASLLNPSNPQEVLNRSEVPWITMKQNEHPKASECAMPTASPHTTSLTECQKVNPIGDLFGLKALWETTVQKENPQIYEPPISAPSQFTVPMTEPQGTPGTPPGYEAQWGIIVHKDNPKVFDPLMSASCKPSSSLAEVKNVNPKGRPSVSNDFWENMGCREKPSVSKSPVSVPCPPLDILSEPQKENALKEDLSGYELQCQCRENSGNFWAFKTPNLDFNMGSYITTPAYVSLGSETQMKDRPTMENLCVNADLVSTPSFPSAPLPDVAITGPQRVLLECKALWKTKEPRKHLWVSDSPCPAQIPPLVPFIELQRINTMGDFPRSEATWKDTENTRKCLSSEPPFLNLNPAPSLVQQCFRVSPIGSPFKSEAWCGDSQRKSNFLVSKLPAPSLSQHLLGVSPSGVISDFKPAGGYMQNENFGVSVSPVWEASPPPNSVLKSHISETSGDQCNYKPNELVLEQRKDSWATELPVPSFLSAPSQEPHSIEFVCRKIQEKETSQGPNPPVMNTLQPTSWPPTPAKAPKSEPIQSGLQKEEMFSETKVEAPSSQGGAVSEVCDHPVIHAWQWSRELKLRLKKLQQSPTFKYLGSNQSCCSSPVLNPPTPESWGLSSCPQQTHPLGLHCCSSSCLSPKVQRSEPLPIQAPYCSHSSSQSQLQASGRTEQESQKNKRMKWKVVAQIPSPGHVHMRDMRADENCLGMGESSNTGVLVSGKKQDKTLEFSAQKRSPRKSKAGKCRRGTAELGSSTVTGKNNPAKACRPAEGPIHTLSKKSQYKAQSSPHTVLAQQLLLNVADLQDQQRTKAGDTQNPHPCKHCPWAPMEKQLPSSTPKAPSTRSIQRLLAKFLGVRRPLPTKSSQ